MIIIVYTFNKNPFLFIVFEYKEVKFYSTFENFSFRDVGGRFGMYIYTFTRVLSKHHAETLFAVKLLIMKVMNLHKNCQSLSHCPIYTTRLAFKGKIC